MTVLTPPLPADPEPDDEDNGPWCVMPPEPCDTGEPATTVRPLGWRDLYGQISDDELILRRMDTVIITDEEFL